MGFVWRCLEADPQTEYAGSKLNIKYQNTMDLNQIKKLIDKEGGKVIIVENGEPVLIISRIEGEHQQKMALEKRRQESGGGFGQNREISQSTELLAKEELPAEELTVEDLPF